MIPILQYSTDGYYKFPLRGFCLPIIPYIPIHIALLPLREKGASRLLIGLALSETTLSLRGSRAIGRSHNEHSNRKATLAWRHASVLYVNQARAYRIHPQLVEAVRGQATGSWLVKELRDGFLSQSKIKLFPWAFSIYV
jgi:hypothetical protein